MAEEIGALRAALSASVAQFESDLQAARDAVRRNAKDMETSMNSAKTAFNGAFKSASLLKSIFPQLAAVTSAAGLAYFVKSTVDAADHMNDLSKASGVSVETLSSMSFAAKQSGLDLEGLATGLKKLGKNMADAASGTGDAKDAFALLGLSVKDGTGSLKDSEQMMLEVADKFAGMEDGAGKTALAMKIFGKAGADLIPMLNEGADGLKKLQQQARDAGVVLSKEGAEAADKFNDNMLLLAANLKGLVLPAIGIVAQAVNNLFGESDQSKLYKETKLLEMYQEKLEELQAIDPKKFPWYAPEGSYERRSIISQRAEDLKNTAELIKAQEAKISEIQNKLNPKNQPQKKPAPVIASTAGSDSAAKAAADATAAIDKQIEALAEQADALGMASDEATLFKLRLQGATDGQITLAKEILTNIDAQNEQNKIWEDSQALVKKLAAEGRAVYEASRTPIQAYTDEIKRLNELLDAGAIDMGTYERASEKAWDGVSEKMKQVKDDGKDSLDELKRAIEGWGRSSAEAFVDFATTGKSSFSDLANSIIKDILRMVAYQQIFKPMFGAISTGATNLFKTPSPDFIGPVAPSAHGNAFSDGRVLPFAKGGVLNRQITFPLHSGMGMAGEAGPEAILPLTRINGNLGVRADIGGGTGGEMKIEIINKSGQPMQVTDSKFDFQDAVLTVWIDGYNRNRNGMRSMIGGG